MVQHRNNLGCLPICVHARQSVAAVCVNYTGFFVGVPQSPPAAAMLGVVSQPISQATQRGESYEGPLVIFEQAGQKHQHVAYRLHCFHIPEDIDLQTLELS